MGLWASSSCLQAPFNRKLISMGDRRGGSVVPGWGMQSSTNMLWVSIPFFLGWGSPVLPAFYWTCTSSSWAWRHWCLGMVSVSHELYAPGSKLGEHWGKGKACVGWGAETFSGNNWRCIIMDRSLKGKTQCLSVHVCLVSEKRHFQALHHDSYNKLSWETSIHAWLWIWTLMRKLMCAYLHSFHTSRHLAHSKIQLAW